MLFPDEPLRLAKQAVDRVPQVSGFWQNLGLVHLAAKEWPEARAALEKAIELRGQADGLDRLALARIHVELKDLDKANQEFTQAGVWLKTNLTNPHALRDEALRRLSGQVSSLLGRPNPMPPPLFKKPFGKPLAPKKVP